MPSGFVTHLCRCACFLGVAHGRSRPSQQRGDCFQRHALIGNHSFLCYSRLRASSFRPCSLYEAPSSSSRTHQFPKAKLDIIKPDSTLKWRNPQLSKRQHPNARLWLLVHPSPDFSFTASTAHVSVNVYLSWGAPLPDSFPPLDSAY